MTYASSRATSTPGSASSRRLFSGVTLYRLRLPKGSRAVVEDEVEQEVLLRPGSKLRVAEISDTAEKGADKLCRGSSRVSTLEVIKDGAG